MYKMRLSVPDIRAHFRDLRPRAQVQFRRELQTVVKPALQQAVTEEIAPDPGPVVHPFEFATEKSKRWYFANKVPKGSKGGSYKRTGQIETSWAVIVGTQIRGEMISVVNLKPASIYVFPGLHQVPGHRRTGWGKDFDPKLAKLDRQARQLVAEAWLRAVLFAVGRR